MDREVLRSMVDAGHSSRRIAVLLGVSQTTVIWWTSKFGFSLTGCAGRCGRPRVAKKCLFCGADFQRRWRGKSNVFCNGTCSSEYTYQRFIGLWLECKVSASVNRELGVSRYVKRFLRERSGDRCERCGWNQKHPVTDTVPLQVHHRTKERSMPGPDDLELLCPNCHALTETWGALNVGSGPRHRRDSYRPVVERARGKIAIRDRLLACGPTG